MSPRFSRRDFLISSGFAASFVRTGGVTELPGAVPAFHLHPQYRERIPLEGMLAQRVAGSDAFFLEKEHDQIARILATWSEQLKRFPGRFTTFAAVQASGFRGDSFEPGASTVVRQDSLLEVRRVQFVQKESGNLLHELQTYFASLRRVLTADFQVTGLQKSSTGLQTEIRYEIVGQGEDFYREQRCGTWHCAWTKAAPGEYQLGEWRNTEEVRSRSKQPLFSDITRHALSGNESYSRQLVHGVDYWRSVLDGASRIDIYGHNGVSVGDIDGNGLDDLYICQPAGLPNRLYRNRGDGTFQDITEASGLGVLDNSACALFADVLNRGHQDLIVVRTSGPLLFLNDGRGNFTPRTDAFHFATEPQGTFTGAAIADYDRDGWLDVYFCLYVYYQGTDQYKYPVPYFDANNGPPNFLLRNNRDGSFGDVTSESGLNQNNTRYSFCCGWTDSNQDGWPDLYVVNDFGRKNLYRNNGDGTFTDVAARSGVEDVGAGMSVCSVDYDNDGREDLYVADMWTAAGERITEQAEFQPEASAKARNAYRKHAMGNSLFRNRGDGSFDDTTQKAAVSMGRWAWSSDVWDFDHDGYADLYITNGMISGPIREDLNSLFWRQVVANSPEEAKSADAYEQGWSAINELIRSDYSWSGFERNVLYANNRDGSFSDLSGVVGLDFVEDGRSFALTDLDGDGRLECVLKNRNGPQLRVLKSCVKDLPSAISFRLRGTKSNRDAIGATVRIKTSAGMQTRTLQAGSGFLSQHSKNVFFGLGNATGTVEASIRWPSGLVQSVPNLPMDHLIYVDEGTESVKTKSFNPLVQVSGEEQPSEKLPDNIETWLLSPVTAPLLVAKGSATLLYLWSSSDTFCRNQLTLLENERSRLASVGLQLTAVELALSEDAASIYNLLYRSLFDRHRDLMLPTSFLVDEQGQIVKIYQGGVDVDRVSHDFRNIPKSAKERIAKALPFEGNASTFEFGRNHLSLGSVFFQRGYYDQAEIWFGLALRDDPTSAEAHYGLGSVYLKRSKTDEARSYFEQATKLGAGYPDTKPNAWNNLGLLAVQEGQIDAAIGYFEEALRINPDHLISLENLGNAYRQQHRWEAAQSALERALVVNRDDAAANYSLAMVFAQTNRTERAYEYLTKALQLRPDYPEAMNNLGILYLRTQRRDQAVAEFEACIRQAPTFDQSYLNLARVYVIEGMREKARTVLLALLKQHPDHVQARAELGQLQ